MWPFRVAELLDADPARGHRPTPHRTQTSDRQTSVKEDERAGCSDEQSRHTIFTSLLLHRAVPCYEAFERSTRSTASQPGTERFVRRLHFGNLTVQLDNLAHRDVALAENKEVHPQERAHP